MQKVIDYKVIVQQSFNETESSVKRAIADGWVPSGPIVVAGDTIGQAMIRFEETSE